MQEGYAGSVHVTGVVTDKSNHLLTFASLVSYSRLAYFYHLSVVKTTDWPVRRVDPV